MQKIIKLELESDTTSRTVVINRLMRPSRTMEVIWGLSFSREIIPRQAGQPGLEKSRRVYSPGVP